MLAMKCSYTLLLLFSPVVGYNSCNIWECQSRVIFVYRLLFQVFCHVDTHGNILLLLGFLGGHGKQNSLFGLKKLSASSTKSISCWNMGVIN